VAALVQAQPLVALSRLPGVEADDELHELVLADGGHPEEIGDVDDPQSPDLMW
jgi:hypothetical protein